MDMHCGSLVSKALTFGSAFFLGALLTAAIGSLALGVLGFSLPHLCAGW